jgi:hypothetical protein
LDVFLFWVLCAVRYRSFWRADHSSRVVLPTVMRRYVWSRNLLNEEAMAHLGSCRAKNEMNLLYTQCCI